MTRFFYKLSFSLFICTTLGLLVPLTALCQTEKLGIVQLHAAKGHDENPEGKRRRI